MIGALRIDIGEETPDLLARGGVYVPGTLDRADAREAA